MRKQTYSEILLEVQKASAAIEKKKAERTPRCPAPKLDFDVIEEELPGGTRINRFEDKHPGWIGDVEL